MSIKFRVGKVYSETNKNTGEECIYDDLGRETIYTYSSKTNKHYQIYCHGFKGIDRDKRMSPIQITHKLNDGTEHEIRFVADFKHSYKYQTGFHLNLTEDSRIVMSKCIVCNVYFKKFNHILISPEKEDEMRITDADSICNQIIKKISQNLLPDYTFHSSTNLLFN